MSVSYRDWKVNMDVIKTWLRELNESFLVQESDLTLGVAAPNAPVTTGNTVAFTLHLFFIPP